MTNALHNDINMKDAVHEAMDKLFDKRSTRHLPKVKPGTQRCEFSHLTRYDERIIEEAMDSEDLEVMFHAVDRIVRNRVRSATKKAAR
jgi:hypothetical protein